MACVKQDGTITASVREVLNILGNCRTAEEISRRLGQPLYKIRSNLRELVAAGLVRVKEGEYLITEKGRESL